MDLSNMPVYVQKKNESMIEQIKDISAIIPKKNVIFFFYIIFLLEKLRF